jgi:acyl-coenzyme A thioesterase PaaI-like protein
VQTAGVTQPCSAPATVDDDGWLPLDAHPVGRTIAAFAARSFVTNDPDGDRLRVRYEARAEPVPHATADEPAALRAEVWFGPKAEGPPGHAHGGSVAAVLDEAMGLAVWLAHRAAVAAHIEVDFRNPVPLGMTARVQTAPGEATERKSAVTARLVGPDGTVYGEATGIFVLLGARHAGRFKGGGA